MRPLNDNTLAGLLAEHQPPCISLYQPTQRSYPDSQQNAILYRDLLRQAEEMLRQMYKGSAVHTYLERFRSLTDDAMFWTHRHDGLAVFGCSDLFWVIDLPRTVPSRVVVADSFHVKPLLRMVRDTDRYQVLCLTRSHVRLMEGDRHHLDEIDLNGVPETVEEALGETRVPGEHQSPPDNSTDVPRHYPGLPGKRHIGHPVHGDYAKVDARLFFQVVDRTVWERHSRSSNLPLLLAALPENQVIFRQLSRNQYLLSDGIECDPDALSAEELRRAAWDVVAPHHQKRLDRLIDSYCVARSRGQGSEDPNEVARAAHIGRVGTLLLDADRHIPGRLDPDDGRPIYADPFTPDVDDLLDDLGEKVLRQSGSVFVIPGERMPSGTGLAAIHRY